MGNRIIDGACEGFFTIFLYGLIGILGVLALIILFSGEFILALVIGGLAFFFSIPVWCKAFH